MEIGDLVRAVFMPLEPTGWYREMLDTGRLAVIIGHLDRDCNDAYAEIWYNGANFNFFPQNRFPQNR